MWKYGRGRLVLEGTPPNTEGSFFIRLVQVGQALHGLKPVATEVGENTPWCWWQDRDRMKNLNTLIPTASILVIVLAKMEPMGWQEEKLKAKGT